MPKNNPFFEILNLVPSTKHPYLFELIDTDKLRYYRHQLLKNKTQIIIQGEGFDIAEHGFELHSSEVYDSIFDEIQFSHAKYYILASRNNGPIEYRLDILLNKQGLIDDINLYTLIGTEQQLPQHELNRIIGFAEQSINPFISQMAILEHQLVKQYEEDLRLRLSKLHEFMQTPSQRINWQQHELIARLKILAGLNPEAYLSLSRCITGLLEWLVIENPATFKHDNMNLARYENMLSTMPVKSIKDRQGKLLLNPEYEDHMQGLIDLYLATKNELIVHSEEKHPFNALFDILAFLQLEQRYKERLLDYIKTQVILKDFKNFEQSIKSCPFEIPCSVLNALIEQDKKETFIIVIEHQAPLITEIYNIAERLIRQDKSHCLITLNLYYPLNYLTLDSEKKPLACRIFHLNPNNPIRKFLLKEHQQFKQKQFYLDLKNILLTYPWHEVKLELALINQILKIMSESSSSSLQNRLSNGMTLFSASSTIQLAQKIEVYKSLNNRLTQEINEHGKIDMAISESLKGMLQEYYKCVLRLLRPYDPIFCSKIFSHFDDFIERIKTILPLNTEIKSKKQASSRSSKRQFQKINYEFKEAAKGIEAACNKITQEYQTATEGVNQALIELLHLLHMELDAYVISKDRLLLSKIQARVLILKTHFQDINSKEHNLIETVFLLPYKELIHTIETEIEAGVSALGFRP